MTRKYLILFCSLVPFLVAVNAAGQYSHIKLVVNSDHDLSTTSTTHGPKSSTETEVCFFCHAPHQEKNTTDPLVINGPGNPGQTPLWNKYLSSVATYGVYSSTSFNALLAGAGLTITDLGGAVAGSAYVSNLCLSCHDGTVGVNTLYHGQYGSSGNTSPAMINCANGTVSANNPCFMPDAYLVGNPNTVLGVQTLANLHPINFTYNPTLAAETVDLATPQLGGTGILGGSRWGVVGLSSGTFLPLFAGPGGASQIQCATCHAVHDNTTVHPFLRVTTSGSALCLDCHGA